MGNILEKTCIAKDEILEKLKKIEEENKWIKEELNKLLQQDAEYNNIIAFDFDFTIDNDIKEAFPIDLIYKIKPKNAKLAIIFQDAPFWCWAFFGFKTKNDAEKWIKKLDKNIMQFKRDLLINNFIGKKYGWNIMNKHGFIYETTENGYNLWEKNQEKNKKNDSN